jgi:hypothetical protein
MVRYGLVTAGAGVAVAMLGATPFLLMVLLVTPGEDIPDDFEELLCVGLGLGGGLIAVGLSLAALGTFLRRQGP